MRNIYRWHNQEVIKEQMETIMKESLSDPSASSCAAPVVVESKVIQLPHDTLYQTCVTSSLHHQSTNTMIIFHGAILKDIKHINNYQNSCTGLDVRDYVQYCRVCQLYKLETLPGKFQQTLVSRPAEVLGEDLMGPFTYTVSGDLDLIFFVDCCTGWRGKTTAHILTRAILSCWVIPAYILLDRDQLFISSESKESCRRWNLQQKITCLYHSETNLTERLNFASYVEEKHKTGSTDSFIIPCSSDPALLTDTFTKKHF